MGVLDKMAALIKGRPQKLDDIRKGAVDRICHDMALTPQTSSERSHISSNKMTLAIVPLTDNIFSWPMNSFMGNSENNKHHILGLPIFSILKTYGLFTVNSLMDFYNKNKNCRELHIRCLVLICDENTKQFRSVIKAVNEDDHHKAIHGIMNELHKAKSLKGNRKNIKVDHLKIVLYHNGSIVRTRHMENNHET